MEHRLQRVTSFISTFASFSAGGAADRWDAHVRDRRRRPRSSSAAHGPSLFVEHGESRRLTVVPVTATLLPVQQSSTLATLDRPSSARDTLTGPGAPVSLNSATCRQQRPASDDRVLTDRCCTHICACTSAVAVHRLLGGPHRRRGVALHLLVRSGVVGNRKHTSISHYGDVRVGAGDVRGLAAVLRSSFFLGRSKRARRELLRVRSC